MKTFLIVLLLSAASWADKAAPAWQDATVSAVSTTIVPDNDGPLWVTQISFQTSTVTYSISCYRRGFWKCPNLEISDRVKIAPAGGDLRILQANGKEVKRRLVSETPVGSH
jgi:hypothetical protein